MDGVRKHWQCRVCSAVVYGIVWGDCIKGKQFHQTPSGGECRAVNFDMLPDGPPDGSNPVEAKSNPQPKG